MPRKLSAKDIAFEKERCRYRKECKQLESKLAAANTKLQELQHQNNALHTRTEELEDWVERLLTYMDLSEEELRFMIDKEKEEHRIFQLFQNLHHILNF